MANAGGARSASSDKERAVRLRRLRDNLHSLGKRSLEDTFKAGEALEEAAELLKGRFSAWVVAECGIEPRTALGHRKVFRVLHERREWLVKKKVSPTTALVIASASPEGRERALSAIDIGRSLNVAEAKALTRGETAAPAAEAEAIDALHRSMRSFCGRLIEEARQIVSLAAETGADEAHLADLAERSRKLRPMLEALAADGSPDGSNVSAPLTRSLIDLADATTPAALAEAALRVGALARENDGPIEAERAPSATLSPQAARPASSGIRLTTSAFPHGLTSFEICAGAGGQALGLARAGFRHLGLVERDPSACETLRAAFGEEHVIEANLVGFDPGTIGPVDLLAGGVPCQPYSTSGKRKGAKDDRDLFPQALRLVERLEPRAVMLENVTGILEIGNDMHRFRILARLRRLGYVTEWRKVHATHFGVPQRRERAILIAFREKEAMRRFLWPTATHRYAEEPYPVVAAIDGHLRARGWVPPMELLDRMDRAAPTITGGSDRKQGIDFGKRKSAAVWGEMGFVQTRIGTEAPPEDHVGDVVATNAMLASLQGFPGDSPFRGSRKSVFRQVANAFPAPVALHLGCAIASALTGETIDPARQDLHQGMQQFTFRASGFAAISRRQREVPAT